MFDIWKKLNLKNEAAIAVVDAPESFESEIAELGEVRLKRNLSSAGKLSFFLVFATKASEVSRAAKVIGSKTTGDTVVWIAYPKGSSKRYKCEFNRDTGWAPLGEQGFEGVRQVAIDEDWSAIRFRRVKHVSSMKRNPDFAMTREGKKKAAKKK